MTKTKRIRFLLYVPALFASLGLGGDTFRDDRVSLHGAWKFQLRRDNQLLTSGPVSFGPVSASSQAMFLEPWPGVTSEGRWRTAVPWPVAATLLGSEPASIAPSQIWKPHAQQQGPSWWRADFEKSETLASVRVLWAKPGPWSVTAETSEDGAQWQEWARVTAGAGDYETRVTGPSRGAHFLRLTFTPSQFEGVRGIQIFLQARDGSPTAWQPRIQRVWYEALRRVTPADEFQMPAFSDAGWADIQVPGYWEAQRFSEPTWWQPDDTVGYYRRTFNVPERWRGRHVRLRFDGVNNSAQVWVNGREIGYHESGFTAFEWDVTPFLRFGAQNVIAVRVAKWTLTHEYDTDDAWFLGGIWRDVYLYSLPAQRIDDFVLRTELDGEYRDAVLRARVSLRSDDPSRAYDCEVEGTLRDGQGNEVPLKGFRGRTALAGARRLELELSAVVPAPRKWTAETPHLYSVELRLRADGKPVHEFRSTVGFRQIEVKGPKLLLNGVPLKLRGVVTTRSNPHDAPEDRAAVFAREIRVLKESNVNAIRSHTTPLEEDFLDLCDQHGIYVLPDVPYVWVNEWDFRYLTEGAVSRAREVYEQHKNRASVILWHIGNENDLSSGYRGMGRAAIWLHENDPTRPVTICRNRADMTEFATAINDLHYYPMRETQFLKPTEAPLLFGEFHALPEEIARLADRGFVETWGRSLEKEWAEFEKRPWLAGGLICCWDDGSVNGNIGPRQWGVVNSQRQPKDVAYHIRKVFAPVRLSLEQPHFEAGRLRASLNIRNLYNFTDLDGYEFRWELRAKGERVAGGSAQYQVAPSAAATFPLDVEAPSGADTLRILVHDPQGYFVQNEDFAVTPAAAALPASAILDKAGVTARPGRPKSFRLDWRPGSGLSVRTPKGEELLAVVGLVLEHGKTRKENVPLGLVTYGDPRREAERLVVPFRAVGDGATLAEGQLTFEAGVSWLRASYEMTPVQALSIRDIGLRLRLAGQWQYAVWDRASLWSSGPEGWADGPTARAPLEDLARSGSRRNLYWLALEGGAPPVVVTPASNTMHLRFAGGPRELVLSDFLDSGDFLGKFDLETVEKKMPAGQQQTGGVTLYFLQPDQWARLAR